MKLTKKMIKEAIKEAINEDQLARAIRDIEEAQTYLTEYSEKLRRDPEHAFDPKFPRQDGSPHKPLDLKEVCFRAGTAMVMCSKILKEAVDRSEDGGLGPTMGGNISSTAPWDTDPGGSRNPDTVQKWKDSSKK